MIEGINNSDLASGFIAAIDRCGEILAVEFPADPGNPNELVDTLVIKD